MSEPLVCTYCFSKACTGLLYRIHEKSNPEITTVAFCESHKVLRDIGDFDTYEEARVAQVTRNLA